MNKQIEIEFRSIFDKRKSDELFFFLTKNASSDLGEDDKNVFFFILPDKLLKVTHNISKQSAKITLKLNKIGLGSDFEEIEIPISPDDIQKTVHIFKSVGFLETQESLQKRHNFVYKGVEIALKYSKDWGYHAELEIMIDDISKKDQAEVIINKIASELGIEIMTDEELREFTEKIDKNHQKDL